MSEPTIVPVAHQHEREDCVDPRGGGGFRPELWPQIEEEAAHFNGGSDDRPAALIRHKFLLTYYRLNESYRRLLDWRAGWTAESALTERVLLQEIEHGLRALESLMDMAAALGVTAEAIRENGFVTRVSFTSPPSSAPNETLWYSSSLAIPIPD
jgi:hypothetical protein